MPSPIWISRSTTPTGLGGWAGDLVRRCAEAEAAARNVLIGFRLGDVWADVFTDAKYKLWIMYRDRTITL